MPVSHDGDEERIRRRAYEIWLSEGKPEGQGDAIWHRAAAEVAAKEPVSAPAAETPDLEAGKTPG